MRGGALQFFNVMVYRITGQLYIMIMAFKDCLAVKNLQAWLFEVFGKFRR